jgi:hypothetical protein
LELVYFVILNGLAHLAFVGCRMTTTLFALELGASRFTVGLLMSLFALLPMLLSVSAGRLIDRTGPRRPLLFALGALACATVLPFVFPSVAVLYLSTTLVGTSFMVTHIAMNSVFGAPRLAGAARGELLLARARLLGVELDRPAHRRLRHRWPRPRARLPHPHPVPGRRLRAAAPAQAPAAAPGAPRHSGGQLERARPAAHRAAAPHLHRQRDARHGLGPLHLPPASLRRFPRPGRDDHRHDPFDVRRRHLHRAPHDADPDQAPEAVGGDRLGDGLSPDRRTCCCRWSRRCRS